MAEPPIQSATGGDGGQGESRPQANSTATMTATTTAAPPPKAPLVRERQKVPAVRERQKQKNTEVAAMNGPLYKRKSANVVLVRRQRRKDEGAFRLLASLFVENQIGLSFNLIALLFLAHALFPSLRPSTRKFFTYSYYNSETGEYGVGADDGYFITFCIIFFTGMRAFTMEYILAPFAKWRGVTKRKDLTRFSEQAWLLTYYAVFWPLGMYIYYNSEYFLNLRNLWTNWPDRELEGIVKGYMLAQWAFWVQQILVLHMEERRKDHWQMFAHHIITNSLIFASYTYHQTRVGNLILVLMDVVDIFLPLAKCLKYFGYTTICDAIFAIFMLSWVLARHVLYLTVCWSIYAHIPEIIPAACFTGPQNALVGPHDPAPGYGYLLEPFINPEGTVCFTNEVRWGFLLSLLSLQVLTLLWFGLIVKVAVRVVQGTGADDVRSDDEAEDEEEVVEEENLEAEAALTAEKDDVVYAEEDVGVDQIDLRGWERRHGVRKRAPPPSSSGVSLPGHHSDRKELLGRIGCEKQVD